MQHANKKNCFVLEEDKKLKSKKTWFVKSATRLFLPYKSLLILGSRSRQSQSGRGYSQSFFLSQTYEHFVNFKFVIVTKWIPNEIFFVILNNNLC